MKRWHSLLTLALVSCSVTAMEAGIPTPTDLPGTDQVTILLRQDPAVQEALAHASGASHVAGMLRASPHEWTVKASGQQRRYPSGPTSQEWSAQLERTIRLPGKKALDRELGNVEIELADARLDEAVHEAARDLMELWMTWLHAQQAQLLIAAQEQAAQSNLDAARKRQRAGDASMLEVNVAAGDAAGMQRQLAAAQADTDKARARLDIRFPGVRPATPPTLGQPRALAATEQVWRDRIVATSDPLRIAELEQRKASQQAERVRADRLPDPTIGVFTASEFFARERVIGISVSIPLPGGYRRENLGRALAGIDAASSAQDRVRRLIDTEIAEAYADASSNHTRWQLAEQGARNAGDTARLTQRAYTLGEADVQTLLLARRQSMEASGAALDARVLALRSYYRLLIDAHRIWGLSHD